MELREWLIISGLALVSLIVIDGIRRLKRQHRVPRLDQSEFSKAESSDLDPEEAKLQAEINWELPNGGARVVKPEEYGELTAKPSLERQDHPGPSSVLAKVSHDKPSTPRTVERQVPLRAVHSSDHVHDNAHSESPLTPPSVDDQRIPDATVKIKHDNKKSAENSSPSDQSLDPSASPERTATRLTAIDDAEASAAPTTESSFDRHANDGESVQSDPYRTAIRTQPEINRRKLRSTTVGVDADESDHEDTSYQLVDFNAIKDSFKDRVKERLDEHKQNKRNKLKRKEQLKAERAERELEAEKRKLQLAREEAEQRQEAQRQAEALQAAHHPQQQTDRRPLQTDKPSDEKLTATDNQQYPHSHDAPGETAHHSLANRDDNNAVDANQSTGNSDLSDVVRPHPTLAKAMRHDMSGKGAANTLKNAEEVIVISVMSRDDNGFDGVQLLDLLMMCGLRYSSEMGVFHRLETEHPDSELQFSMVNVLKPGTFPIQEMDTFVTPGITFLLPLPGAEDSSAAFEAMVETAMVVVRYMGGELKDENRSVMTAQTIEFARQRVHEFERRHHLHRAQAN